MDVVIPLKPGPEMFESYLSFMSLGFEHARALFEHAVPRASEEEKAFWLGFGSSAKQQNTEAAWDAKKSLCASVEGACKLMHPEKKAEMRVVVLNNICFLNKQPARFVRKCGVWA